uniref:Reverse transcriptase domain-containing protein n=1 Tax=Fagus sylvatica TaxID=28930 RepID=A0A2N9GPM4_FAGSY
MSRRLIRLHCLLQLVESQNSLVARVRPVLDKLISPLNQNSAFIPGKWIAENQITIHELLHSFKRRKVKGGFMALKIDLQKAYDRINWGFLKAVLENFGFPDIFVNWIMECISSVSFSILINGGKSNFFTPTRGLRQGDPLSPYLFILCQEVLSRIIEREHATGSIQGVKMNVGGPSFTNVMYADDIMLFAKASRREAAALNTCLEKYCDWSGQLINRDKSGVIFSKLVSREQKRRLKLELEMKCVKKDAVYLGAPLFTMANKSKDFKFLQDKLEARLKGWRCKCLSWAGRSTLIKSVAHAIPSYTFSSFEVPVKVCDNLDATTRRFWWNPRKESGRYLAWKSWEHLCRPKKFGGHGFRKAKKFNEALLSKLTWLIASGRDSPCMIALHSKYHVDKDWLKKDPIKNASYNWKAIEKLKGLISKGACFLVGDGTSIDVWTDPWVPWLPNFTPIPKTENLSLTPLLVSNLISWDLRAWNLTLLNELFETESVQAILKITIPASPRPDNLVWIADPKGLFSVKSALTTNLGPFEVNNSDTKWYKLWKLKLHERLKVLIWKDWICFPDCTDIVNFVCDPPSCSHHSSNSIATSTFFSIRIALTLECIWNMRNQVVHNGTNINLLSMITALDNCIEEHSLAWSPHPSQTQANHIVWEPPPPQVVKLNVDAALAANITTLAVTARDHCGNVLKAWAKPLNSNDSLEAEAAVILWAVELALSEKYCNIIVESDAQLCIDALTGPGDAVDWKIRVLCSNTKLLALSFMSCSFVWVRRDANHMAHSLAKAAPFLTLPFHYNQEALPPSVLEAWRRDLLSVSATSF